jgi:GDPmannose 4,6-dehydratase
MAKKALITGITGQDGSYLAELLLSKGYEVYGMIRRTSNANLGRIEHIISQVKLVNADLLDEHSLIDAVKRSDPDEVYNLAAQSFVPTSWNQPVLTGEFTALGVTRLLEAVRLVKPTAKFYQASSSEMFGKVQEVPQTENTSFYPRSPYGVAKLYGHWITVNYRESYDMFTSSGILFNHESPRRGLQFVTKKITTGVACIKNNIKNVPLNENNQPIIDDQKRIHLGNLEAKRDWGFAGDYVEAMWLMLQQEIADDYVVSTNETHTIKEFLDIAFNAVGIKDWEKHVYINPDFYRPAEVDLLIGSSKKAEDKLGWKPKTSFKQLVEMMIENDLKETKRYDR